MTDFNEDRWEDERRARLARVTGAAVQEPTLFERCVEDVDTLAVEDFDDSVTNLNDHSIRAITRTVIQTLLEGTLSLRTAEELTRVLAEGAE